MLASRAYAVLALSLIACSNVRDDAPAEEESVASTSLALNDSDPVSAAADESCTTTSVKGLSTQLVEEIQCLRPGTMKSIEGIDGLSLGSAVFPWLQAKAVDAVVAAQKDRGVALEINSALRTLPQQYLLYRWYKTGRCNISLAASPGESNHESGLAIDIEDNAGWREVMSAHDMKWLGSSDPVHFDYVGEGRVDLGGLSVLAFQKLWNRNHPEDPIGEDSTYGEETETRLALAPVGGFPKGAECSKNVPQEPATPPPAPERDDTTSRTQGAREGGTGDGACTMTKAPGGSITHPALGSLLLLLGTFVFVRRRQAGRMRR